MLFSRQNLPHVVWKFNISILYVVGLHTISFLQNQNSYECIRLSVRMFQFGNTNCDVALNSNQHI